jgi:hypothetical protein
LPSRGHWLENDLTLIDYDIAPRLDASDETPEAIGEVIEVQHRRHFVRTMSFAHYAEGWLYKKGDRSVLWKERFFVLRDKVLYYYKARGEIVPTGYVDLAKSSFEFRSSGEGSASDYGCYFDLITSVKTYRFKSSSAHETRQWARIFETIQQELLLNASLKKRFSPCPDAFLSTSGGKKQLFSSSSSSSSGASELSSDSDVRRTRNFSVDSAELDTFSHLRLNDAIGKIKSSPQLDQRPLRNAKHQQHIDVPGDKIGFLQKRGHVNKAFKDRLFALRDKILYYFKYCGKPTAQNDLLANSKYAFAGLINLECCLMHGDRQSLMFRILVPGR